MSIVVLGAVFVDIKGFPESQYIPDGRNVGRIEYIQGGVSRNVVSDISKICVFSSIMKIISFP